MPDSERNPVLVAAGAAASPAPHWHDAETAPPSQTSDDSPPASPRRDASVPAAIGPYRLGDRIGEGGFGVVYLAEQDAPIRRTVAIKLIKPGMDSAGVIARFEAERRLLARMDHPGIARVLDAGAIPAGLPGEGRPYFVMEYVAGEPIHTFCDRAGMGIEARVDLFIRVCEAVQHAHQRGALHRDLKPSNLLVRPGDRGEEPRPKVIDFGVAKALLALDVDGPVTRADHVVGTPEYMSPEQADAQDVDTRTDVYALGVVLYQLLTGQLPHGNTPRQISPRDLAHLLRTVTPIAPSRVVADRPSRAGSGTPIARRRSARRRGTPADAGSAAGAPGTGLASGGRTAASGSLPPTTLTPGSRIAGELDCIVLKALAPDRERRYESPGALARDLRRALDGDAVEARPDSLGYRLRVLHRRHRWPFLLAEVVLALLILTGSVIAAQAAELARLATQASAERDRTEQQARVAAAADEFIRNALTEASKKLPADANLIDLLTHVAATLDATPLPDPIMEARIRLSLADSMEDLGRADLGEPQVKEALRLLQAVPAVDPLAIDARSSLGVMLASLERLEEALPILRAAHDDAARVLPPTDPNGITITMNYAVAVRRSGDLATARPLYEDAVKRRTARFGPLHPETISAQANMVSLLIEAKELAAAADLGTDLLARAIASGVDPARDEMLKLLSNTARAVDLAGRLDEAAPLYQTLLEGCDRQLGRDHPNTVVALTNVADAWIRAGRAADAFAALDARLPIVEAARGEADPSTLRLRFNLAIAAAKAGDVPRATQEYQRAAATLAELNAEDTARRMEKDRARAEAAVRDAGGTP